MNLWQLEGLGCRRAELGRARHEAPDQHWIGQPAAAAIADQDQHQRQQNPTQPHWEFFVAVVHRNQAILALLRRTASARRSYSAAQEKCFRGRLCRPQTPTERYSIFEYL